MSHSSINLEDFKIPTYILVPDATVERDSHPPLCPVLVFINSKSGGQLGGGLLVTYRSVLNESQVFDLGDESPDQVLQRIYLNFEKLRTGGDSFASTVEERLRIIVSFDSSRSVDPSVQQKA